MLKKTSIASFLKKQHGSRKTKCIVKYYCSLLIIKTEFLYYISLLLGFKYDISYLSEPWRQASISNITQAHGPHLRYHLVGHESLDGSQTQLGDLWLFSATAHQERLHDLWAVLL